MSNNELILAVAGSGKTTHLVDEAIKQKGHRMLITTYTEANEAEIRKKIFGKIGYIPENITIQTWFSFLLEHGVRPYQGHLYEEDIKGMILESKQSGLRYKMSNGTPVYHQQTDVDKHYFSPDSKIFSDKISKFVLKCNSESGGAVVNRLSRIYSHIYIDEVQDLASYDLDFLKLLFQSNVDTLLVGDPRQVVYLTHHARRLKKYSDGKIRDFIAIECIKIAVKIDEKTLSYSHRNNEDICSFASRLYPEYPLVMPCDCTECKTDDPHQGVFLVKKEHVQKYLENYGPMQLRLRIDSPGVRKGFPVMNFGVSKGQSFNRVLIHLTDPMRKWMADNSHKMKSKTRAQFYVAVTRARESVAIVYDFDGSTNIEGVQQYKH